MQFIPAVFVIQIPHYHQLGESCGVAVFVQAFRKFGSAIEMRANIDGPGQLSRVASHKRLFSSDRILGAEALAGERGCESSDSASGEGRAEPVGQLVSAAAGRDRLSQST